MKKILRYTCTFLLALVIHSVAHAQQPSYAVQGRISDKASGSPVAFAVIYLPDLHRSTTSGSDGSFRLDRLTGPSQKFTFTCTGYLQQSLIVFFTDSITELNIRMQAGTGMMEEVLILAAPEHSSASVESLSQRGMRNQGAFSISDGISHLPGVTQLTTGAGISKPVIRGMYGNRIQTIVMGMRFDNQQWQDEHGLGLQDIGIDRVELIKGPAALIYGSEAMGGVLNVIEEKPADADSILADASLRLFSNTYGAGLDAGVRSSRGKYSWRVRLGGESHADYSDGDKNRVVNSRFDSYTGKAGFGFSRGRWNSTNNYVFSKSDFGFIMDSGTVMIPDERLSRSFDQPHHTVFINLFTSQNNFFTRRGDIFRLNTGGHINRRMENEGGSGISLDMQLITVSAHAQYERLIAQEKDTAGRDKSLSLITGLQSQYQDNRNFGFRIIVPDAVIGESSLYAYIKRTAPRSVLEGGIRGDLRFIRTYESGNLNTGPYALPALSKTYPVLNGSAGASFMLLEGFWLKASVTSGYRSPNLAELSSNGVHEGTLRYEVGDPGMKIEQNFCGEAGLSYESKSLSISATAYHNRFLNYIYLQPTAGDFFGFRIYRYIQTNATLHGGEATIDWNPAKADWLDLSLAYTVIRAKTDAGNYLPFIPTDRLDGNLKFELGEKKGWKDIYLRCGFGYYFRQDRPAQFETATGDYLLLNAGAGCDLQLKQGRSLAIDLCCNNLLNKVYYDHLSRFKEFSIYNIGRNISLNLKYNW